MSKARNARSWREYALAGHQLPTGRCATFAGLGALLARLIIMFPAIVGTPGGHFRGKFADAVGMQPISRERSDAHVANRDALSAAVGTIIVTFLYKHVGYTHLTGHHTFLTRGNAGYVFCFHSVHLLILLYLDPG